MILGSWKKLSAPLIMHDSHEPLPQLGLREERQWRILMDAGFMGGWNGLERGTYPSCQIASYLASSYYHDIILLTSLIKQEWTNKTVRPVKPYKSWEIFDAVAIRNGKTFIGSRNLWYVGAPPLRSPVIYNLTLLLSLTVAGGLPKPGLKR